MSSWSFPADSVLPWTTGVVEDQRFNRWLKHALGILLMIAILLPWLPLPVLEKPVVEKKRSTYTRLIIEEKKLPPPKIVKPAPVKKKPQAKKQAAPVKKPSMKKSVKPVSKPKVVKKSKPVDLAKQARDKAAKTGVLAFADDLAAMRQQVDVSNVKVSNMARGAAKATSSSRKLLSARASTSVAGIASAALSKDTGGVALSGRETTRIYAPAGDFDAGAEEVASDGADYAGRSSESVRRVMDANKGSIFSIYNRALRKDGSLAGKVLFNMVIEPSGVISAISLVSSELADEALVRKILARIKMVNFGAEPVAQTNVNYSFDFLPY
ncbi:MAG: AgmX/PglI C-terminal domain-containing protein [Pseudomonadales bacterium]|nr:AgmX/PglI C-terminal domain-containing protein [Gammaproteobacteria bacterium]NNL57423.1 AgmX/PglI C-terminal domain-containing protein [Pseudomonadales bacterium]